MNTIDITNGHIRRALLGLGNPDPDEALEMSIFSEEIEDGTPEGGTFSERLYALADETVDDYLRDDLSREERAAFESGYLRTLDGHDRLAFISVLGDFVDSTTSPKVPEVLDPRVEPEPRITWMPRFSSVPVRTLAQAAVVLLAVAGAGWMLVDNLRLEGRIEQLASDRTALEEQIASFRDAQAALPEVVTAAWLVPGLLRGPGEVERVTISEDSSLVRFQLDLGIDDYESYRAALHNAEGDEIWSQSKLRASPVGETVAVTVTLPSEVLPHGDYYFRLSGITTGGDLELVGRYHFRVLVE
jgi:hypothetical protein